MNLNIFNIKVQPYHLDDARAKLHGKVKDHLTLRDFPIHITKGKDFAHFFGRAAGITGSHTHYMVEDFLRSLDKGAWSKTTCSDHEISSWHSYPRLVIDKGRVRMSEDGTYLLKKDLESVPAVELEGNLLDVAKELRAYLIEMTRILIQKESGGKYLLAEIEVDITTLYLDHYEKIIRDAQELSTAYPYESTVCSEDGRRVHSASGLLIRAGYSCDGGRIILETLDEVSQWAKMAYPKKPFEALFAMPPTSKTWAKPIVQHELFFMEGVDDRLFWS
jgi:hypothetical protein